MPIVVHLSDTHFGAHHGDLVESLLADVAAQGPDLVVVSGDLTQRARPDQFRRARAWLDRMPGPVLSVLGNHDLPLLDLPRRLLSPTRRFERCISADLNPVVTLPGLAVVGLDTMPAWRWKAGYVSPRRASRVREALGLSPPGAWRLLVTHHPVLPAGLSGLVGRRRLVDACARGGVAVMMSGHLHTAAVDVVTLAVPEGRRSALAVVAGTATSRRTRGAPNSYGVLRLSGPMEVAATLTLEVRQPVGAGWSAGRTARFEYTDAGVVACGPDRA